VTAISKIGPSLVLVRVTVATSFFPSLALSTQWLSPTVKTFEAWVRARSRRVAQNVAAATRIEPTTNHDDTDPQSAARTTWVMRRAACHVPLGERRTVRSEGQAKNPIKK
jgi:hypothetical protein